LKINIDDQQYDIRQTHDRIDDSVRPKYHEQQLSDTKFYNKKILFIVRFFHYIYISHKQTGSKRRIEKSTYTQLLHVEAELE
jgi:hypothetical protein